jgi:hypothetical protein
MVACKAANDRVRFGREGGGGGEADGADAVAARECIGELRASLFSIMPVWRLVLGPVAWLYNRSSAHNANAYAHPSCRLRRRKPHFPTAKFRPLTASPRLVLP